MAYLVKCEKCAHQFQAEKWHPGMECPKCHAADTVPATQIGQSPTAPPSVQARDTEAPTTWKQKPIIGAVAVLLIIFAWMRLGCWGTSGKRAASVAMAREMAYAEAQTLCLGRYLAENHSRHDVLVLTYPAIGHNANKRTEVLVNSLVEGFGEQLTVVAQESPPAPDTSGPMGLMVMDMNKPEVFDAMIEKHPDCDMIVSLINLPHNYAEMKFWKMPERKRPKLVLADANIDTLEDLFKKRRITAAVVRKPRQEHDLKKKLPKDPTELFNTRYILVDGKNVDQVVSEH